LGAGRAAADPPGGAEAQPVSSVRAVNETAMSA